MENIKKAIVFAGGGSKGAYQLGAWKALNELGEEFQIATGTSIGSINAAFYVQNDFGEAEKMWSEVTAHDIMKNGINMDVSFDGIFSQRENLVPFFKNYFNTKSVDNSPFLAMIQRYFKAEEFFSSQIDFALMTVNLKGFTPPDFEPVNITKNEMKAYGADSWKWIAASCACFPVFPPMEIDGLSYIDGGYYDNIPVASAINLGAEKIVVIDLKTENNHEGYIKHPRVKYIKPSRDLGTFLNFNREVLDRSVKLGYNDTMKAYGKYLGKVFTFILDEKYENKFLNASEVFLTVLSKAEAEFDFSKKVRLHRVNKLEGCTYILADYLEKESITEKDAFISALEMFLRVLNYDDEIDYSLNDILFELKVKVDRLYPLLEFDTQSAFAKVKEFIREHGKGKTPEIKKYDEDRMMLIFTSLMRTLQKIRT